MLTANVKHVIVYGQIVKYLKCCQIAVEIQTHDRSTSLSCENMRAKLKINEVRSFGEYPKTNITIK